MRLFCLLAILGCNPSGTLYLAGRDPGTLTRVDTATGMVSVRTGVRQMGGGDPPYMLQFTGGRLVTFALGRSSSFAPDLTHPKSLGEAWFFVPSSTPGRVWNILKTPRSNVTFRGVREVTVDGQVTLTRRWRVPGWPVGAVSDGLVVQRRRLEVWSPVTRRLVRRLPALFPIAFRGDLAVSCADPCRTLYLNERPVRGRFGLPFEGEFSPDGRWLALPAEGRRIALVDVAAASATVIAGARTDNDYPELAWASSGWLFWNAGGGRLGAWRPGQPARRLGVKVGAFVDMTAD
jgi:hypothetical protein